jgi:ABC-2 type transport system permease protein
MLIAFVAVYFLGSIAEFPHWILDLVPFTHSQHVPDWPFHGAPVVWQLLIDAALIGIGLAALRRRDPR